MNSLKKLALSLALGLAGLAGTAHAADVDVNGTGIIGNNGYITTSTTWTANNVYHLKRQIYVTNGATLTIEAGTLIVNFVSDQGSLAVTRGSKIVAVGTSTNPIIFTSAEDVATWAGTVFTRTGSPVTGYPSGTVNSITTYGNRFTGASHDRASEWGNVTIMGRGYISASHKNTDGVTVVTYDETNDSVNNPVANTGAITGLNKANMEGLNAAQANGDPFVVYGGNDDNDDSGTLAYVSLRNGGKVIGVGSELNGLSLGGVGRATDIHHIDIYGNVDDGIEIWGGTVNLKYLNIWNIGDDSFDLDQGWRGKAQFALLVQGYSDFAAQGSGTGDNMIEADGAERSDAQPFTTATLYNFTVIGQPDKQDGIQNHKGGDHGIALRDNAHLQIRNCIFTQLGERLIVEESSDAPQTDTWRYGINGTLSYVNTWTTAYTESFNTGNAATGGHANANGLSSATLQAIYASQSAGNPAIEQGFLLEVTDCLFADNKGPDQNDTGGAYNNASVGSDAVFVTNGGASKAAKGNVVTATLPVTTLTRGPVVNTSGSSLYMANIATLDPRPSTADGQTSVSAAPADGFFTPAKFRGAFSDKVNWAKGWTAADAYGYFVGPANAADPASTISLSATSVFTTVNGVTYSLESSTDGINWSPVQTVIGDGTIFKLTDVASFDNAKVYRIIAQ